MPDKVDTKTLIYNKALSLLSRREHSRHELFLKLKAHFAEFEAEIKTVLTMLEAKNYLTDQRFMEMLTRHRASQGYGPNYIRQELKSHQITLNEAYLHEPDLAQTLFEGWLRKFKTRFKHVPDNALAQAKLTKYFLQRGYSLEQIKAFLTRVKNNP